VKQPIPKVRYTWRKNDKLEMAYLDLVDRSVAVTREQFARFKHLAMNLEVDAKIKITIPKYRPTFRMICSDSRIEIIDAKFKGMVFTLAGEIDYIV